MPKLSDYGDYYTRPPQWARDRIRALTKAVIDKATDLINEHGWIRHDTHTPEGYCMVGALNDAAQMLYLHDQHDIESARWAINEAVQVVQAEINQRLNLIGGISAIPEWNDNYCRDADEAVEVLKLAGERLGD